MALDQSQITLLLPDWISDPKRQFDSEHVGGLFAKVRQDGF
jgi:hypothetical protein